MNKECHIIQDLIPLVNDGVASEESQNFVYEHCLHCETCAQLLEHQPIYDEKQLNKKWQKRIRLTLMIFVLFIVLLTTSFTATSGQFYNFLFMPLIGGMGVWLFHKKVYWLYGLVFIVQIIMSLLWRHEAMDGTVMYVMIYWFLMTIGIVIEKCYSYAFSRREDHES